MGEVGEARRTVRLRKALVLAAAAILFGASMSGDLPRELAARARTIAAAASKGPLTRRLEGLAASYDPHFFRFLVAAREKLPRDAKGVAVFAPRIPSWGGGFLAVYFFAPLPAALEPPAIAPGWVPLCYRTPPPPGRRQIRVPVPASAPDTASAAGARFEAALAGVAFVLAAAAAAGWIFARALFPPGRAFLAERAGWSVAAGTCAIASTVALCFLLRLVPTAFSFVAALTLLALAGWIFRLARPPSSPGASPPAAHLSTAGAVLVALAGLGALIYAIRALTEPMWSNDFVAIWGLKGKSMFADGAIPDRLFRWKEYEFSNPAYPIGLPLLYAGIAFARGSWDDHALALLFPLLQVATLLVLYGWVRRRSGSRAVALLAAALLASFEPLYSAWLTGMAEVPGAFSFLLFGAAYCDAIDAGDAGGTRDSGRLRFADAGAARRLAFASLVAAATKNEGLFLAGVGIVLLPLLARRLQPRRRAELASAIAIPIFFSFAAHRVALGGHPLRALDFGFWSRPDFGTLLVQTLREEWAQLIVPAAAPLLALAALARFARRAPSRDRILLLIAPSLAVYLLLPAFCTFGPAWLVHWSVGRVVIALVPLAAAGIASGWGWVENRAV